MVKISIKRFKFYSDTEFSTFTFNEDEITLLKGTSNSGKSTILEALYWCLYGSNKKVAPKGYTTTVKNPTIVKIKLTNGTEITRTKPPDTLEVTGFNKEGDILVDEAAQYWIEENFGTKSCFLATSYMRQGRESPLVELKNTERIQLLQELSFGKILDEDKDNDPKYYTNKIDTEIKLVKNNLLSLEGKLSGLEDCYKKQSKSCESYYEVWKEHREDKPDKSIIGELEKDRQELEDNISQSRKKLSKLRKKWTEYEDYIKEKDRLKEESKNNQEKIDSFPYKLGDMNDHLIWLSESEKKKEMEEDVERLKIEDDVIEFLKDHKSELDTISKEIILYKEHDTFVKSLKINDDKEVESEIISIQEKLESAKEDENILEKHELMKESYKHKKRARLMWENKKKEIAQNVEELKLSKEKYENYFNDTNVSDLISILNLENKEKTNKAIIAEHYTSKEGFTSLTDSLKKKIYELGIKTVELSCPECKAHLTLDSGELIKYHKVENAKEIISSCEKGLKTIKNIDNLMKEYLNNKKLPLELEDEEPPIPDSSFESMSSPKVNLDPSEKQKLTKRLRLLQSYRPLKLDLLPSLLETHPLKKLETYLSSGKNYKNYLDALSKLNNLVLFEKILDLDKKKCQKYITDYKVLISKKEEIRKSIEHVDIVDKPDENVADLEKTITKHENKIREFINLVEAGKRIIEIDKLKTSLEENRREIKDLTDRHVALDRIKQIISDTKSLALEETVETLNALLDEISRIMYDNETRIVVSMFKELKSRDYLKAELNVQLITGYGEEAIAYDADELSGGEKSRLSLALTLALSTISSTPFLFIDEGMSSMHASLRDLCSKIIREYSAGKVVVNICHTIGLGNFDKVLTIKEEDNI